MRPARLSEVKREYAGMLREADAIFNEIENISRVVYDVSSKPPATIE